MMEMAWKPGWLLALLMAVAAVSGCSGKDEKYSNAAAARNPPPGMATIPAGCFDMGDAFGEGAGDELPVHKVCLPAFYMDVHEVTNAEYKKCLLAGGCRWHSHWSLEGYYREKKEDQPITVPYWQEAKDYCGWAGKRLPTEAEWEYAARGGLSGKRYPRGDTMSCQDANYGRYIYLPCWYDGKRSRCSMAVFSQELREYPDQRDGSPCRDFGGLDNQEQKVGSYPANGYGLYDMDGNVREWVNDFYSADYYSGRPDPDNDPPGPGENEAMEYHDHVVRGGCWDSASPLLLRVSFRDISSGFSFEEIGFRCASDLSPAGE